MREARDSPGAPLCLCLMERKAHNIARAIIAVFISVCIALVPLDIRVNHPYTACLSSELSTQFSGVNIQKSEAHAIAPAIPAAGAALAALAAELGISEAALAAGLCAIGVAATGLVAVNTLDGSTDLAPAPGFKPWDDLSPDEQSLWGSNSDGETWPLHYQKQAIAWWALKYGLLEQTPNGDLEPSNEPENDPNGSSRWNKIRNALIALSVGGASIPLYDALGSYVDGLAAGLKDTLFGTGTNSLNIAYFKDYTINGGVIPMMYVSGMTVPGSNWITFDDSEWNTFNYRENNYLQAGAQIVTPSYQLNLPTITYKQDRYGVWSRDTVTPNYSNFGGQYNFSTGSITQVSGGPGPAGSLGYSTTSSSGVTLTNCLGLNPNYSGVYVFGDIATYSNGVMSGLYTEQINYGQLSDTPDELAQTIINNDNYNTFISNYANPGVEGYERAITVPANFGQSGYTPSYSDFVVVTPSENVTTLPGDSQIGGSDNPDTPTTQFQQDFGERVGQLLAQPFDQLFPFCLIGDLRRLTGMIEDAVYGQDGELSAQDVTVVNGTEKFVIPLSGFGDFFDDIEFEIDLTPVTDLATIIRPFLTALFIVGLLVGTFRFFLNRGGE